MRNWEILGRACALSGARTRAKINLSRFPQFWKTQVHDIPILQRQKGNSASWNDCRTSTAVGIPQRDGPTKKSNCCRFAKTNHRNFDLFFSQSCSEHSLTATAGNIKARALCNRFPIPRHDRPASCLQCQARRIWLDMCLRGARWSRWN